MVEASESMVVKGGGVRSAVNTNYHIGANFHGAYILQIPKLFVNRDFIFTKDQSLLYVRLTDYVSNQIFVIEFANASSFAKFVKIMSHKN